MSTQTDVGQKVKETWPTGTAKDGRKYSEISDAEIGSMFILKHGETKALSSLGIEKGGEERTKQEGAEAIIGQLEEIYFKGNDPLAFAVPDEFGSRAKGTLKNIERALKPGGPGSVKERLNTYKRLLESKRSLLAKAAGDAGNLALQEQILAGKGLPDEKSTPGEAVQLFKGSRSAFGLPEGEAVNKFSTEFFEEQPPAAPIAGSQVGGVPKDTDIPETIGGIAGLLAGGLVGPAAAIPGVRGALGGAGAAVGGRVEQLLQGQAPEEAFKFTPKGRGLTGKEAGQVGVGALTDLLLRGVTKIPRAIKPIKTAGKARLKHVDKLAEEGGRIGSKGLKSISKKLIDRKIATEKEIPALKRLMQGKSVAPREALKLLQKSGKKSFSVSSDPKLTQAADLYQILRDNLRTQFKQKAPKVIEETTRIAKALPKVARKQEPLQRFLNKSIFPGAVGAGVGIPVSLAIQKLLGKGN